MIYSWYTHLESDSAFIDYEGQVGDGLLSEIGPALTGTIDEYISAVFTEFSKWGLEVDQKFISKLKIPAPHFGFPDKFEVSTFRGAYWFLSNFAAAEVTCDLGIHYHTVEHAFQAMKSLNEHDRRRVASLPTPMEAKKAGKRLSLRADWEQYKVDIMEWLVVQKFANHPQYATGLRETLDNYIIEGNTWGDRIWGAVHDGVKWVGQNHLGRILMKVRRTL